MNKYLLLILLGFGLIGCATAYQSHGVTGGFRETQLSENMWKVIFSGNDFTSREQASDFTLLRCAEITIQSGYRYFKIINVAKLSRAAYDENTIVLFKEGEKPENDTTVYDAKFLNISLKEKYKINS